MNNKFAFLKATRFWVMLIGVVAVYLQQKGIIGQPETALIASLSALFVLVRTTDRFAEKIRLG